MNGEEPKVLDMEVIDMLRDAIGNSINNIINLYVADVPVDIVLMQQALASDDLITLHRLSHSLKSSSANVGAMSTSVAAADLEHSIRDGEIEAAVLSKKLDAVIANFDQAQTELKKLQTN